MDLGLTVSKISGGEKLEGSRHNEIDWWFLPLMSTDDLQASR